jgi:regulator of sirC expression with transglutaminase-like and TPR domain
MIDDQLVHEFVEAASSPDAGELPRAALLIARLEYRWLDPEPWLARLTRLGALATARLERVGRGAGPRARVEALNELLFEQEGFAGNESRYDDPRNSFLNDVLERRTGIPITLSLVYLDVARRAGVPMEGVNFPGHFLVRCPAGRRNAGEAEELIIDPFHRGRLLTEADCRQLLRRHLGEEATFERRLLATAGKLQILARMLVNLKTLYVGMRSFPQARETVRLLLALDPRALTELRDHGLLSYHLGDHDGALRDLEGYLRASSSLAQSEGLDEESRSEYRQIWEHVKTLRRRIASFN